MDVGQPGSVELASILDVVQTKKLYITARNDSSTHLDARHGRHFTPWPQLQF